MADLARPATNALGPGHCCPRCLAPNPVEPLALADHTTEVRYVYECPRCRHAWWNAYNATADDSWQVAA